MNYNCWCYFLFYFKSRVSETGSIFATKKGFVAIFSSREKKGGGVRILIAYSKNRSHYQRCFSKKWKNKNRFHLPHPRSLSLSLSLTSSSSSLSLVLFLLLCLSLPLSASSWVYFTSCPHNNIQPFLLINQHLGIYKLKLFPNKYYLMNLYNIFRNFIKVVALIKK